MDQHLAISSPDLPRPDPAEPGPVVLRLDRLVRRYGTLTAVDRLSLDICAGEIFGLLGPNGAGKTTTIQMICGLLQPDSGQVLFHGQPVRSRSDLLRARMGVCPQSLLLWGTLTCLEQLEFIGEMYNVPRRTARQRGLELLETMGLAEKRNALARTLSGGMQRRLNLILALVHDPEILVLDEPEAGLDPQSRVMVRDYIRGLARKKTILLTTHNMDEADRVVDRVAIVDHGRLLALDTPEALKRRVGDGDVLEIEVRPGHGLRPGGGSICGGPGRARRAHSRVGPGRAGARRGGKSPGDPGCAPAGRLRGG